LFLCEELKLICGRFADDRFIVLRKLLVREPGFVGSGGCCAGAFDLLPEKQIIEIHHDVSRPAAPR